MRRNLLYVAAGMALLTLTAQVDTWRRLSVHTPTTLANVTSITFVGTVTASSFHASSDAAGYGTSNGWFIRTTPGGDWVVDGNGGTHLQMKPGEGPRCFQPMPDSTYALATKGYVDGATNGVRAYTDGATNGLARVETNWWAVFEIPMADPATSDATRWYDFTLKAFLGNTDGVIQWDQSVFRYTSADRAANGTPSWELFGTNWLPLVVMSVDHPWYHEPGYVQSLIAMSPTNTGTIEDSCNVGNYQVVIKHFVYIRDTGAWFHPTNGLQWFYHRQNNSSEELWPQDGIHPVWRAIEPKWVNYDPRPRTFWVWELYAQPGWQMTITYPHQPVP